MAVLIEVEKDNDGKVSLDYKEIPIRSDKKGTSISTSTQLIHR
jgi:hypothetical protein